MGPQAFQVARVVALLLLCRIFPARGTPGRYILSGEQQASDQRERQTAWGLGPGPLAVGTQVVTQLPVKLSIA